MPGQCRYLIKNVCHLARMSLFAWNNLHACDMSHIHMWYWQENEILLIHSNFLLFIYLFIAIYIYIYISINLINLPRYLLAGVSKPAKNTRLQHSRLHAKHINYIINPDSLIFHILSTAGKKHKGWPEANHI
jgi:hypothetical protein